MSTSKEPCGCVSNETHWISLCEIHKAEHAGREHEMPLDSLRWLMSWYDRFPTEDNLRHVIIRIKAVGAGANARPDIVQWIRIHSVTIVAYARRKQAV